MTAPFRLALVFSIALLLAAGCGRREAAPADGYAGYAEADTVPFASSEAGRIVRLHVRRGERVAAGAPLFALDGRPAQAAPADVEVADVMVREGDTVRAAQPVLALLDRRQLRARFFVPPGAMAGLAPGRAAVLACEGCGAGVTARISFVARRAEPGRSDGAFLVEATPDGDVASLRPGQPLTVRLAGPSP